MPTASVIPELSRRQKANAPVLTETNLKELPAEAPGTRFRENREPFQRRDKP